MRLISTAQVKPDMVLARPIYNGGCLILGYGATNLERYAHNLKRLGIDYIYVEDKASEGIDIPDPISVKTRLECKETLRRTFEDFVSKGKLEVEQIHSSIETVINEILENQDVLIGLSDISSADEYTFAHSVSTTVYALLLARKLGYSKEMMDKLAIGTILHDIGKVYIDKDVIYKQGRLTEGEYEYVKNHTIFGYHALKKCRLISELSRIVSLTHHENMDGTGYPNGIMGKELHEFSRIVAIADVYDALTSSRCYRKRWTNQKAIEYLMKWSGTKFDTNLVGLFIQQVAVYQNGTMVKLSDGREAIVKDQNLGVPLRPIIRIIKDRHGRDCESYDVDLMKELNTVILDEEIDFQDIDNSQQVG
ncbi:MAG TPA: HD-GYP domain-containing protein [Lachnospiraceae bacterium]|nr:HD-GYP domain-containing protein [Lachnospiraceae bacterium]